MIHPMPLILHGRIIASHPFAVLDGNMNNWPRGFAHMIYFTADDHGVLLAAVCCFGCAHYPWACTKADPDRDDGHYVMNFADLDDSNCFAAAFAEATGYAVTPWRIVPMPHGLDLGGHVD